MTEHEETPVTYTVVVNDEEQYSIWFADRELPAGWRAVGVTGPKEQCLDHIRSVWTDITPLSVRRRMAANAVDEPRLG